MVSLPRPKSQVTLADYEKFNAMVMPMINATDVIVALAFDFKSVDAKLSLEIGASLLLDKKVILVVNPGVEVPSKIASLVHRVVHVDAMDAEKLMQEVVNIIESTD